MNNPATGNGGAFNWLFQRFSGILIAAILFIHLGTVHFGISVVDLGTPAWKIFHLVFVILLLYHILNGFWLLIEDYVHTPWLRISLFGLSWLVGIAFFIMGFVTIVPLGT